MTIDASVPYRIVISPQDNGETAVKQAKNWSGNFANDVTFTQATTTDDDIVFVAYDTHDGSLDDMLSAGHETPSTVAVLLIPSGNAKEGGAVDLSEHVVVHEFGSSASLQGDAASFEESFADQLGTYAAGGEPEPEPEPDPEPLANDEPETGDEYKPKHATGATSSPIVADESGLEPNDSTQATKHEPAIIGDVAPEFEVPEERPVDEVIDDAREEWSKTEHKALDEGDAYDQNLGFAISDVVPNNVADLGGALVPHTDATDAETEALDDATRAQIESLVENVNVSLAGTYDAARVVIGEDADFGLTKRELLEQFYSEPSEALTSHAESLGAMRELQDDIEGQIAFVKQSYRDAEDRWVAKQVESLRAMYRARHPDRTDEIVKKISEATADDFSAASKRVNETWQPAVYDVLKRLRNLPESAVTTTAIQLAMTRQRLQQQLNESVQNAIDEARKSGRLATVNDTSDNAADHERDEQTRVLSGDAGTSSFERREKNAAESESADATPGDPVVSAEAPITSALVVSRTESDNDSAGDTDVNEQAPDTDTDNDDDNDDDSDDDSLDESPSQDSAEQDVRLDPETGEPIDFDEDAAVANEATPADSTDNTDDDAGGSLTSTSLDELDGTGEDGEGAGTGFKALSSKQKKMTLGIAGGVLALGVLFTGFVTPGFFTSNGDGDGETNQSQTNEPADQAATGGRETDVNDKYRVGDTLRVVLDGRGITSVQITSFGDDGGAVAADSTGSKVTLSQTILDNYVDRHPELFKDRTDADSVKEDNPLRGDD